MVYSIYFVRDQNRKSVILKGPKLQLGLKNNKKKTEIPIK